MVDNKNLFLGEFFPGKSAINDNDVTCFFLYLPNSVNTLNAPIKVDIWQRLISRKYPLSLEQARRDFILEFFNSI